MSKILATEVSEWTGGSEDLEDLPEVVFNVTLPHAQQNVVHFKNSLAAYMERRGGDVVVVSMRAGIGFGQGRIVHVEIRERWTTNTWYEAVHMIEGRVYNTEFKLHNGHVHDSHAEVVLSLRIYG